MIIHTPKFLDEIESKSNLMSFSFSNPTNKLVSSEMSGFLDKKSDLKYFKEANDLLCNELILLFEISSISRLDKLLNAK